MRTGFIGGSRDVDYVPLPMITDGVLRKFRKPGVGLLSHIREMTRKATAQWQGGLKDGKGNHLDLKRCLIGNAVFVPYTV
jgi:hypothetical protein